MYGLSVLNIRIPRGGGGGGLLKVRQHLSGAVSRNSCFLAK